MSDPAQIEQELRAFLDIEENIRKSDRLPYLMAIINKHFATDRIDHVVTHRDFDGLMSAAKTVYATTKMPMTISNKEVSGTEFNYVLMMEAFVDYLSRNKLLKRLVRFDHRRT